MLPSAMTAAALATRRWVALAALLPCSERGVTGAVCMWLQAAGRNSGPATGSLRRARRGRDPGSDRAWPGTLRHPAAGSGLSPARTAFADHLNLDRALARPVELAKVDRLPAAERQPAVLDRNAHGRADQTGERVAARVALGVAEARLVAEQVGIRLEKIANDIRVCILVDGDGGGRMRRIDNADTVGHRRRVDDGLNVRRDVDELTRLTGLDGQGAEHRR